VKRHHLCRGGGLQLVQTPTHGSFFYVITCLYREIVRQENSECDRTRTCERRKSAQVECRLMTLPLDAGQCRRQGYESPESIRIYSRARAGPRPGPSCLGRRRGCADHTARYIIDECTSVAGAAAGWDVRPSASFGLFLSVHKAPHLTSSDECSG